MRRRRLTPLPTALLVAITAACRLEDVPRPRFPQLEQASESVQNGGERYRDHQHCVQASKSADDVVRCMQAARWSFVARGPMFPQAECWEAREHGELDRLGEQCFVRDPEHR